MITGSRSLAAPAALSGAALVALLAASCSPSSTSRTTQRGAQEAVAQAPVSITISPRDGSQGVALDSPVVVEATNGQLLSVSLLEAGSTTPVQGEYSSDRSSWDSVAGLDSQAGYTVVATASNGVDPARTARASFSTLEAQSRLLTSVSPADGSVVGVGEPVALRFNDSIPAGRRTALLSRISISSTPPVAGAWHWFSDDEVHFRTENYWPAGSHVTVTADLKGFDVGDGTWGLGDWTSSFTVGDKHLSMIDDNTHTMNVYDNDQLIDTWPVSMGKSGFATIEGTLIVLYKQYAVKMNSCTTFGGAACIPGSANYYDEDVYYDTAVSSDGYFIHSAPWSVYAQGHYDVSHGCVNLSPARAEEFYNFSQVGDIVQVTNSPRPADASDGEGDWQIPFDQFANSGGPEQSAPASSAPGGGL